MNLVLSFLILLVLISLGVCLLILYSLVLYYVFVVEVVSHITRKIAIKFKS